MPILHKNLLPLAACAAALLVSGCGTGLCVGGNGSGGCLTPRLVLSGLEGLAIRKNDCYPVTLSAVDADGNRITNVTTSVSITASSGAVTYNSLQGCQTYDNTQEKSVFVLSPLTPEVVFYFRSDVEGAVSLAATPSTSIGMTATKTIEVGYAAFDAGSGFTLVNALSLQSDGKVLVGGDFTSHSGGPSRYVARVNSDGTFDTSFAYTGSGLNAQVRTLSARNDGKVLVGGLFNSYNGTATPRVARLEADGSLDTTFAQSGTGLDDWALSLCLSPQGDGKIVVGGYFTLYNGTSVRRVARLNADGSLDTTFAPTGTGLNSPVHAVAVQNDGKVLVGGDFTLYNGTSRRYAARLNSDGSLDTSFALTGSGFDAPARALSIQSDGKVLVGGIFSTYNGTYTSNIARLNSDGSLDPTFLPTGSGLTILVSAISVQSDGKVVVGGLFGEYNGTSRPYVARLNSDGSLDTTFEQSGLGLSNAVFALALQTDGKIVVGGQFATYDATVAIGLARLTYIGTLD